MLWHCGGCLIKQARRYAARTSTRRNEIKPNKKSKPRNSRKSKDGNENRGSRAGVPCSPYFFTPPHFIYFCSLPQNCRFCNSREFTACACLDINEHNLYPRYYRKCATRDCGACSCLDNKSSRNIFPINTALLPRALRKVSRLYLICLHKVTADLLPN